MMLPLILAVAAFSQTSDEAPPSAGTIAVEPAASNVSGAAAQVFDDAVERALTKANFVALQDRGHSRFIALVSVSQTGRGAVSTPLRTSGPAADVGNWGAQVQVALPNRKAQLSALVVTELRVEIVGRSDRRPIWRGAAVTVRPQDAPGGDTAAVAQKLADALLAQYPAQLAGPISVP